ncbi:MAG: GNAT family N-acetyltransferase [Pseudomonadota bacterium]
MTPILLGKVNRRALAALTLKPTETDLIASNPIWIAEAALEAEAVTFGLFKRETPVGMMSLIDPRARAKDEKDFCISDCLYVWRIMIDADHRGMGIGRDALDFAAEYAALLGLSGLSLTTADQKPGNALGFYKKIGFIPTERRIKGEIELIKRFAP